MGWMDMWMKFWQSVASVRQQHLLRFEGLEDGDNRFMGMKSIIELENV